MKTKVAAALAALAFVLTGCGSEATPTESPTSSAPAEASLTQWVKDTGLFTSITAVTDGLSTDVANLTNTDVKQASAAFTARAAALEPIIASLSALPATDAAEFELLRGAMLSALQTYADAAATLGTATAKTRSGELATTTQSMSALTAAVQALVDYINTNGTETVHSA